MKQLDNLEKEISGGTTATVSLIYKNKLFVANVGKYKISLINTIIYTCIVLFSSFLPYKTDY